MPPTEHLVTEEADVDVLLGGVEDHLLAPRAPQARHQDQLVLGPDLQRNVALFALESRRVRDLIVILL